MPFDLYRLDDEPIVVIDCHAPFDFTADIQAANQAIAQLLEDELEPPIYRVYDFHEIEMDFGDLVASLAAKTRAGEGSIQDERIRTVMVGTHDLVRMKSESLRQTQYGGVEVPVFDTQEMAIDFCRRLALAD